MLRNLLLLGTLLALLLPDLAFGAIEEIHTFQTADGKTLAITRKRPDTLNPQREPLLLVHGFASNRFTWDLTPGHSITEFLVNAGYDCWQLELRGHGRSWKPDWTNPWGYDFSTEEYITLDFPPAVDYVLQHTGAQKLFAFGHSMGGMIIYAYLETHPFAPIKGAVVMGSPGQFGGSNFIVQFLALFQGFIDMFPVIHADVITAALVPLSWAGGTALGETLWNFDNMTPGLVADLARDAVDNISTKVIKDFLRWENTRDFTNHSGSYSYRDHLDLIQTPMLFIAGGQDGLGVHGNVRVAYDRVSSKDKSWVLLAQSEGFRYDYGHLDMVCGVEAPGEVYPILRDWVARRDGENEVISRILSPVPGALVGHDPVAISGDAWDDENIGIALVEISTDGGQTFAEANGTSDWTFQWTPQRSGTYTLASRATDNAGNVKEEPFHPVVTADIDAPGLTIVEPMDGALLGSRVVRIAGMAPDASGLDRVELSIDQGIYVRAIGGGNWSYDWTPATEGVHEILVHAVDRVGNDSMKVVNVTLDLSAPIVTLDAPGEGAVLPNEPLYLQGSASDTYGVGYVEVSTDGGYVFAPAEGTLLWRFAWTPPGEGEYVLQARAVDRVTNVGLSSEIHVTVAGPTPKIYLGGWTTTALRQGVEGEVVSWAYVPEPSVESVEVAYEGIGLGLFLQDDGQEGDNVAGDSVFTYQASFSIPAAAKFLLGLETRPAPSEPGRWPWLTITP